MPVFHASRIVLSVIINKVYEIILPAGIYLFKVNNENTRTMFRILFIMFVANFVQISLIVHVFPLLTLDLVNAGWE